MKNLLKTGLLMLTIISSLTTKAQVPVLSSYPSANAVIFLDFDGHTVNGTSWNYNGPIYCAASGLDNAQITSIYNRVAEDYRPFTVNVTTDSTKFLAVPLNRRMRVIITTTYAWYGSGAGGVSFVNSFRLNDDTPCFVFSSLLGSSNPEYFLKKVAEAASHEAGHTLGLYHQATYDANCNKTSDYNYGYGTGEIGWAPIMGVGYGQNFTLWNNGPNSYGCTNYQNDLDVITSTDPSTTNGITYRADDHTSTFTGATNAPFVSGMFNVGGIVERNTDQDMIKFIQPATGRFELAAIPYNTGSGNIGSNLDLQVTLFSPSQAQLNVFNPGVLLSSVIDTILNAGTYYLRIEGKGNVYAPNYASLGSYTLQGKFTSATTLPLRQLILSGQLSGDKHQFSWLIDADEQVTQQILEISTDGRNYSPVSNAAIASRSFLYKPYVTTNALYRLNVTFDNGQQYYSNVISLKGTGTVAKPKLVTNFVVANAITVTSPGNYNYAVYDFNGKTIRRGQLTNGLNTIDATGIVTGMYMIRFVNASEEWSEKLVRQ